MPKKIFQFVFSFTRGGIALFFRTMFSKVSRIRHSILALTGIAALAVTGLTQSVQGADLAEALEHVKWKGIVGTWVDSETKGERVKISYVWKFENKLIEVNSKMGDTESVSLMGFNPETEEVFLMGGNSKGGASLGKWKMDGEDAVLELTYVDAEGEKGSMAFKHHQVDNDTIEISGTNGEGGETFTLTVVRVK